MRPGDTDLQLLADRYHLALGPLLLLIGVGLRTLWLLLLVALATFVPLALNKRRHARRRR